MIKHVKNGQLSDISLVKEKALGDPRISLSTHLCTYHNCWGLKSLIDFFKPLKVWQSSNFETIFFRRSVLAKPSVFTAIIIWWGSVADVKMEIPVLVRSLKSSILSSTSFQMGKTFWGAVNADADQSWCKANMVAQGDGEFGPLDWPKNPSKQKKWGILYRVKRTF